MANEDFSRVPDTGESLRVRFGTLQQRCHDVKKAHFARKGEAAEEAANVLLHLLNQALVEIVDLRRDCDHMKKQINIFLNSGKTF